MVINSKIAQGVVAIDEIGKDYGKEANPNPANQQNHARIRSYSEALKGNRDSSNGWELKYTKPASSEGVVITESEWDAGATLWNTTLVGYPIFRKISFNDMTKFVHNWW